MADEGDIDNWQGGSPGCGFAFVLVNVTLLVLAIIIAILYVLYYS
jgi:hypothetical protein